MSKGYLMELTTEVVCNQIMNRNNFSYTKKWASIVWAAIHRECPTCKAQPEERCINMAHLKVKAREHCGYTKWPHPDRTDWTLLMNTLHTRGYK